MNILVKEFNVEAQFRAAQPGDSSEIAIAVRRSQLLGGLGGSVSKPDESAWQILQVSINEILARPLEPKHWSLNKTGELVKVPLFPYALSRGDATTILRFGLQFGIMITELVRPKQGEIDVLFVAVGTIVQHPDRPTECECWIGLALKMR